MRDRFYVLKNDHPIFGDKGRMISNSIYKSLDEDHKKLFISKNENIYEKGVIDELISEFEDSTFSVMSAETVPSHERFYNRLKAIQKVTSIPDYYLVTYPEF